MKKILKQSIIKHLRLLSLLCFIGYNTCDAQSISWAVVNSSGYTVGDDARLQWTMGEPLTTEFSGSSGTMRVGFFPFTFIDEDVTASKNLSPEIEVTISPNPASSFLRIQSPGSQKKIIRIVSIDGQSILAAEIENETTINVQSLASGPYIIYVIEATGAFNSKPFIKS